MRYVDTWEEFACRYRDTVRRMLVAIFPKTDQDLLDDLAGEVLLKFRKYRTIEQYDHTKGDFSTYIYRCTSNLARSCINTRAYNRNAHYTVGDIPDSLSDENTRLEMVFECWVEMVLKRKDFHSQVLEMHLQGKIRREMKAELKAAYQDIALATGELLEQWLDYRDIHLD